jgi:acetoin utilization deacetylase AcuC-like enzyme
MTAAAYLEFYGQEGHECDEGEEGCEVEWEEEGDEEMEGEGAATSLQEEAEEEDEEEEEEEGMEDIQLAGTSAATEVGRVQESSHQVGSHDPGTIATDTLVSAHTNTAARVAAGCAASLAEALVLGEVDSGVAVIRPPGGWHAFRCRA